MPLAEETYLRVGMQDLGTIPIELGLTEVIDNFTAGAGSTVFTTSQAQNAAFPTLVYVNQILFYLTTNYTIVGQVVTLNVALSGGQKVKLIYSV